MARVKQKDPEIARLSPNARGWQLFYGGESKEMTSLDEAANAIPAAARVHLAIPCQMALVERLTLPSTNREELQGMAQLQLEKTLPYPLEETSNEIEVIQQDENESTVLSIAVHTESLSKLCEPLRLKQRIPRKITLFAQHIAAACPPGEIILALWNEQAHLALGIFEDQKLSWAHTLAQEEGGTLVSDLSSTLLGASLEGAPTHFDRLLVSSDCEEYREPIAEALALPSGVITNVQTLSEPEANLLPSIWEHESSSLEKTEQLKKRLTTAAIIYLVFVAAAFLFLAILKHQVQQLDAKIDTLQAPLETETSQKKRWEALAPALDRARYTVEVLYQVFKSRPGEAVNITRFEFTPSGFTVEGEATGKPDPYSQAVEYSERLKASDAFKPYKITGVNPQIVKEGVAHFSITGKL